MSTVAVQTQQHVFSMSCEGTVNIAAKPDAVWALLTQIEQQRRWNSTLTSIEGRIEEGGRVQLTAKASGDRVFSPRVSQVVPNRSMVWSDGQAPFFKGVRTFTLTPTPSGTTVHMVEALHGLMLPMIKGSLPDFAPIFETYLSDLKRAAE